jgi:hypothetical protein
MSRSEASPSDEATEPDTPAEDPVDVAAQVEVLRRENERLRTEYARSKRTQYRRTAVGLAGIGVLGIVGGVLFPAVRTLLIALGATGVFAGLLTYYLTPERFITADVGLGVYRTHADTLDALVAELGLRESMVYVPVHTPGMGADCRLFVPKHEAYTVPDAEALQSLFVITDADNSRGVALQPTGSHLYAEFERGVAGSPSSDPARLAEQASDALVEQFELCDRATPDVDGETGRATVGIDDSALGGVDRVDHPIGSFLAVAFVRNLEQPVELDTARPDDGQADALVTLRWMLTED